jgi:hypothetical protein
MSGLFDYRDWVYNLGNRSQCQFHVSKFMYYLGRPICLPEVRTLQPKQLLPICCRYMYANFASWRCIILAGPFDYQKCNSIIAYLLPAYCLRVVVCTSEARSWSKLGRGSVYAICMLYASLFVTIFVTKCGGMIRPSCLSYWVN